MQLCYVYCQTSCQSMPSHNSMCTLMHHCTPESAHTLMCHCVLDSMYLHRLCDAVPPPASTPPHMPHICLFFSFIYQRHMSLVCLFSCLVCFLYVLGSGLMLSLTAPNCIRRGLSRRLRSSLLLNSSPSASRECFP